MPMEEKPKEQSNAVSGGQIDRAEIVDRNFRERVKARDFPAAKVSLFPGDVALSKQDILELFHSQCASRQLDLKARELKLKNQGFYTIGSSGHEGNAAVAKAFRHSDFAFLHYRSGAFMLQRAKAVPDVDMIHDILLSLVASAEDPISGGRHKVFGSLKLAVPPQTSTIASHLPKAVGAAASIKRAKMLSIDGLMLSDGVVLCSFGDASVNHSVAQGAFNSAQWMAHQRYPLPLVFVCEDNGLGISVPIPKDWVETLFSHCSDIEYIKADGLNILDTYRAAKQAERIARVEQRPVFLHLKCVRLLGHAGTDFELQYRSKAVVEADEANDPLLHTARLIVENNYLTADEVLGLYDEMRQIIWQESDKVINLAKLRNVADVKASLIPPIVNRQSPALPDESIRMQTFGEQFLKLKNKLNMSQAINAALTDIMLQYKNVLVFGEDVGVKGGVYRVTVDLQKRFGVSRVFDTLLDETSILGYAIGHAHNHFIPIPEIQFLAYLHNAEDQLRGEAATLSFFSRGLFTNPMVIRVAGLAYQKGFGGHFHNDNSFAVLRDIPGIIVACPSNARDAVFMLRRSVEWADTHQRVIVFLEPIALYMTKDLHEPGDGLWSFAYPDFQQSIEFNELGVSGGGQELAIITYGNGHYLSQQAAKVLHKEHHVQTKIIDLRWLAPINIEALVSEVKDMQHILIVDECRRTGSVSEEIMTLLMEHVLPLPNMRRITAEDCFIPLGDAANFMLPSKQQIIDVVCEMLGRGHF